jgi:hypothetical protein
MVQGMVDGRAPLPGSIAARPTSSTTNTTTGCAGSADLPPGRAREAALEAASSAPLRHGAHAAGTTTSPGAAAAEIEKKWAGGAAPGTPSCQTRPSRSSARSISRGHGGLEVCSTIPAQPPYEVARVHFNYGLAAVRLTGPLGLERGPPRADREPAQLEQADDRAGRRARVRVRLLPDPARARNRRSSRTSRLCNPRAARR